MTYVGIASFSALATMIIVDPDGVVRCVREAWEPIWSVGIRLARWVRHQEPA